MKMTRQEEQLLIERAAAGDRTAAGELIRAHQGSLYAFILRMSGKPEIAEDIVQDAFVRVLANLDRFDPRYRFSTWLFTIAKRLYLNASAKFKPVFDSDIVGSSSFGGTGSTVGWTDPGEPSLDNEETVGQREVLQHALCKLTEDQREIIVLFHQHDWPITRISEHMGMPEGTVKSHLHRGRKKLREIIETRPDHRTADVCEALIGATRSA